MGTSSSRSSPSGDYWSSAKRRTSGFISQTTSPKSSLSGVIGSYLAASGGGKQTKSYESSAGGGAISHATLAGQKLGGFFTDVANNGLSEALRRRGLDHLIGKNSSEVLAGILDEFEGDGSELTESIIRAAEIDTLYSLINLDNEEYEELEDEWDKTVDSDKLIEILETFLGNVIFQQWASDMADKIEKNAISVNLLSEKEDEIKNFIMENIRFELKRIDPLTVNWQSSEGKEIISSCLKTAIELMEE